jgi:hypothetical protein
MYSKSLHLPQFQQSTAATLLWSLCFRLSDKAIGKILKETCVLTRHAACILYS